MRHRLLFVTRTTTRGRDRGPPRSTRVGSTSDLRVIRARSNAWEGEENLIEYGMSQFTTDNRDRQRLEELRDALWEELWRLRLARLLQDRLRLVGREWARSKHRKSPASELRNDAERTEGQRGAL
jgi:hypothetical protein